MGSSAVEFVEGVRDGTRLGGFFLLMAALAVVTFTAVYYVVTLPAESKYLGGTLLLPVVLIHGILLQKEVT